MEPPCGLDEQGGVLWQVFGPKRRWILPSDHSWQSVQDSSEFRQLDPTHSRPARQPAFSSSVLRTPVEPVRFPIASCEPDVPSLPAVSRAPAFSDLESTACPSGAGFSSTGSRDRTRPPSSRRFPPQPGEVLRWAEARFPNCQQYGQTFATFVQEFKTVFAANIEPAELSRRLWAVKQRGRPVSDFALEFRTLAAAAGWESRALKAAFFQALDESLKDELARSAVSAGPIPEDPLNEDPVDLSLVPKLYWDLKAVFSKSKAKSLPPHRPYDCAIDLLPGAPLPSSRLYNISRAERQALEDYINESLATGIIRPSSSPLGAGFFFVGKKDGSLRPCIDYRGLNQITVKNKYPLPLISSALEPVHDATVFSKLDLRNAYHLVRIRQGDEWKTAFKTPMGHFEYLVMPFGLCNAPSVFQALVNDVLRDFLNVFIFVYLDDILIYSKTLAEHQVHVRLVLQRLLENKLFVKPEKCEFHRPSVTFLGLILESGRVRSDPEKIKAVLNWPVPDSRKQLQRFLGFANFYRRFVRNYSMIAAPLHALTSTKTVFAWNPKADSAFLELKQRFSQAPILVHPDPSKQFTLEIDASDSGVGAVLSQRSSDQKLHPCAYFSRRLTPAERNYDVGDRELLAIKLALEEWRHWLEGTEQPVQIWTDHKNLAYLQAAKRLNSRQARWSLFFSRFNLSISYRPGSKNIKPDALSRMFSPEELPKEPAPILPPSCTVGSLHWEIEDLISQAAQAEPDPGNGPPGKTYVPSSVRPQVLHWFHSTKLFAHPGSRRTSTLITRHFWWPSLYKDVREYTLACPTCAQNKSSNRPPAGLLQPLPLPQRPWSHIALDFVTGLPSSRGMTTILTIVDRFSKACHLVPLRKLPSAFQTAQLLVRHVFRLHGIPKEILSDRGPQFTSRVWKEFSTALGAKCALSSGYHPQSNGQTERLNQELESSLRCLTSTNPTDWSTFLPWVEYAHNSLVSTSTNHSPFEASLGYQPPLFPADEKQITVTSVAHHIRRCQQVWDQTIHSLRRSTEQIRRFADRRRVPAPHYRPGQRVWLSSKDLPHRSTSRKLAPRFTGPYVIDSIVSPSAVRLRLSPRSRIHPTFHVSQLKPVHSSPLCPLTEPPPPPPDRVGRQVRRIVDSRRRGRGWQYLVHWEGCGPEDRSWVSGSSISDPSLISNFWSSRPSSSSRPPGGDR
ncbi:uncharacterized protein LOC110367566 [Fundulus heteroclitus]|uniref:uncharacterized protein LOC110367566 n=1 Tax=Fundulus heteroclitus TaxID=8078 RepID=UPI00165B50D5|nr:uncharacterized protein LOC110367566 [Fundulus heteroclitus]